MRKRTRLNKSASINIEAARDKIEKALKEVEMSSNRNDLSLLSSEALAQELIRRKTDELAEKIMGLEQLEISFAIVTGVSLDTMRAGSWAPRPQWGEPSRETRVCQAVRDLILHLKVQRNELSSGGVKIGAFICK